MLGFYVTHVTGTTSLIGISAFKLDLHMALTAASLPLIFMAGSFVSGALITVRSERGLKPHYDWAMVLAGLCTLAPVLVTAMGWVQGDAGAGIKTPDNAVLLRILGFSAGLQNGAIGAASGRGVRISHMTGLSTDIGLGLARLLDTNLRGGWGKDPEVKISGMRLGTYGSFVLGSGLGAWSALRMGYPALAIPSAVCFYMAAWGYKLKSRLMPSAKAPRRARSRR